MGYKAGKFELGPTEGSPIWFLLLMFTEFGGVILFIVVFTSKSIIVISMAILASNNAVHEGLQELLLVPLTRVVCDDG